MPIRTDRTTSPLPSTESSSSAPTLQVGSRGDDVRRLQAALDALGYRVEVDEDFGPQTRATLEHFQRLNGLAPSGVADRDTWAKLQSPSAVRAPATPPGPGGSWTAGGASNDQVLFVGMNNGENFKSTVESDAHIARGVDIQVIKDLPRNDQIATTGPGGVSRTHDLTTPDGARSFAMTLGLPREQTAKIVDVLNRAGTDSKDEFAQLAQAWARVERGEAPGASRLILSGHHVGSGVYGDNNGKLDWPIVGALAEAMPKAARKVEDLMIAGCYSGGQSLMEQYQSMFPNVKTIVAYAGISPGSYSGATAHQKAWEQATRGSRDDIDRQLFQGMRKGENVAVWTRSHGYQDGKPPASLDELRENRQARRGDYDAAFSGATPITNDQVGPARDYYNVLNRIIQHPQTPAAERTELTEQRDRLIRLLYYPRVVQRFSETHGAKVDTGYRALGLTPPSFQTLGRAEALRSIREFEAKLAATEPKPAEATRLAPLLKGFAELDSRTIPEGWV